MVVASEVIDGGNDADRVGCVGILLQERDELGVWYWAKVNSAPLKIKIDHSPTSAQRG